MKKITSALIIFAAFFLSSCEKAKIDISFNLDVANIHFNIEPNNAQGNQTFATTSFTSDLQKKLDEAGIGTGIHYPVALHLAKAYEGMGFRVGDFPVTENAASHILSFPMFPELTAHQQERVVNEALRALSATSRRRAG